ncbi:MAG TPA: manganese efflux pump MntP family protein [Anaerolineaceae bacterium]|nr:manganese efflux pump MntP family protein [Anaerolineaceae bacterium]
MDLITTLLIAVGVAMDAFAVSLGIGTSPNGRNMRAAFRLAFHFGFFQGGMTLLGWLAGSTVERFISSVDHWIAFALLAFVGGRMLGEGLKNHTEEEVETGKDPSRGGTLVILCVATSIDALAVGLSMALIEVKIAIACSVIALVTFGLSLVGVRLGQRLGARFGKRMEVLGGLILIGIGIRILVSHLMGL